MTAAARVENEPHDFLSLSVDDLNLLQTHLQDELSTLASYEKLTDYQPYPKQTQFHNAGAIYRERLLMAGNQLGKTLAAGMELAMHATGRYPSWWEGRRFDRPIVAWASGVTGESTRDNPQRILLGRPGQLGTGTLPKETIIHASPSRGLADSVDTIQVRHISGKRSQIALKSYEKGREKWQGETLDIVWFDEEPPPDIFIEGLTRTNATGGFVFVTFTPLLGMSEVVRRFLMEKPPGTTVIQMGIDDVAHYSAEQKAAIIASYPAYEREARTKGIPQLGSGRVFPIAEDTIKVAAFPIPDHWPRIIGLDIGWDHPSAAVMLAHDRDSDTLYVVNAFRAREQTPVVFAASVRPWGGYPVAWPHDAMKHDGATTGLSFKALYEQAGLKMLPVPATFEDNSNSVEAGIADLNDRMQTNRLKVFSHLNDWFEEFNLYHRKDGLIVKEGDDLMAATRYGYMMRRFAKTKKELVKVRPIQPYALAGSQNGWMG